MGAPITSASGWMTLKVVPYGGMGGVVLDVSTKRLLVSAQTNGLFRPEAVWQLIADLREAIGEEDSLAPVEPTFAEKVRALYDALPSEVKTDDPIKAYRLAYELSFGGPASESIV